MEINDSSLGDIWHYVWMGLLFCKTLKFNDKLNGKWMEIMFYTNRQRETLKSSGEHIKYVKQLKQSVSVGTMWHLVYNLVYNLVYSYNERILFVQQNRIFYGNHRSNRRLQGTKFPLSLVNVVSPTFFNFLNCVRAITVLSFPQWFDTPLMRLRFFSEIIYPSVRKSYETSVIFWTLYQVLHTVYVLRCDIVKFTFLAALVFGNEPENRITPRDLGLYGFCWDIFLMFAYRCWSGSLQSNLEAAFVYGEIRKIPYNWNSHSCWNFFHFFNNWPTIVWCERILVYFLGLIHRQLDPSEYWWYVVAVLKSSSLILIGISVLYNLPIFIANISFYLNSKQKFLVKKLSFILFGAEHSSNRNQQRKSQLVYVKYASVSRSYNKLLCEINEYNQIISRYLDISFFLYVTIIAYLTFLLFFNETNFVTAVAFILIYASHLAILCCVILTCSTITTGNEAMSKRILQLFNISLKRHFHTVQLMKVCLRGVG